MNFFSKLIRLKRNSYAQRLIKKSQKLINETNEELSKLGMHTEEGKENKYFRILGIRPTDNKKKIRAAYVLAVKRYHPDINRDPHAVEIMKQVNTAYAALSKGGLEFAIKSRSGISSEQRASLQRKLYDSYMRDRKRDFESMKNILASGNLNSGEAKEQVLKFTKWEKRYDSVCKKNFGRFIGKGAELQAMLKKMHDQKAKVTEEEVAYSLSSSALGLEDAAEEHAYASRILNEIIYDARETISKMESESKKQLMQQVKDW
jgi:curved DNA-binding protein CbpA